MGLEIEEEGVPGTPIPKNDKPRSNPAADHFSSRRPDDARLTPSMRDMGRVMSRFMGRTSTGEALTKTLAALNKFFQGVDGHSDGGMSNFQVLGIDAQEHRTTLSAAIVTFPVVVDNVTHVYYFTLLIEGSAPPLQAITVDIEQRRYEVPQTAGDILNDRFLDRVEDALLTTYRSNNREVHVWDTGASVIPTEVDLEKDEDKVRNIVFYATAAIQTYMEIVDNAEGRFHLGWLASDDSLDVMVDFSGDQTYTAAGLPKRTDIRIDLSSNIKDEDGVHREALTTVGGMLELIYSPPQNTGSSGFYRNNGRDQETQHFYPQFTINTLDTLYKAITPELLILGLASAAVLTDRAYWVNGFTPRMTDGKDYRDVGALALLMPGETGKFDIKGANLEREGFMDYFTALVHEDLAYALNIEDRGDLSWIHSTLLLAAQGDKKEETRFIKIADYVTDGHFSARFKDLQGSDLVIYEGNRIINGYYKDEHGEIRDINDFDMLKFLNLGAKADKELALEWRDTFDFVDKPIEMRLDQRIRILQDVLGASSVKIKGYSQQVIFPWQTIEALAQAVNDCGVKITRANSTHTFASSRPRGNYNIGRLAGSNLGTELFTSYNRGGDRDLPRGRTVYTGRRNRPY